MTLRFGRDRQAQLERGLALAQASTPQDLPGLGQNLPSRVANEDKPLSYTSVIYRGAKIVDVR